MCSWDELSSYTSFLWRKSYTLGYNHLNLSFHWSNYVDWVTRHQCIYLFEKKGTDRVGLSPSQMLGSMFLACQSALIRINIYCTPEMSRHGPRTILWGDLAHWTQRLNDTVRCQPSSRTEPYPSSTLLQQAYHRSTQSLCSLVPWDGNS